VLTIVKYYGLSAVIYARLAEPIKMLLGMCRKHVLDGVHMSLPGEYD